MFDSYMLEAWDRVSLMTCQMAHIEALLFNINSKTRIPYPLQTDFHPYRKAQERKKKSPKQMIREFKTVAEAFNKRIRNQQ